MTQAIQDVLIQNALSMAESIRTNYPVGYRIVLNHVYETDDGPQAMLRSIKYVLLVSAVPLKLVQAARLFPE